MQMILLAGTAAVLFVLLDFIWFYFAGSFFKSEIGSIARLTEAGAWDVRYLPAVLVYLLMSVGLVVFVYPLATSLVTAFAFGALFGLVGYGLYDLTNLATLTDWTVRFAIVDMLWGTLLCGTVSAVLYFVSRTWL
jgi:uncharacterized membrane protein